MRGCRFAVVVALLALFTTLCTAAAVEDVVAQCKDSVVQILTYDADGTAIASASGFVVGPELVATCYHVIADCQSAQVKTVDKISYPVLGVVAADADHDLAVLRVKKLNDLQPLALADSQKVKLGETVIALGSPLGLEGVAVTTGVASALRDDEDLGAVVQVSSPISHGNSGGPLLDMNGQVIGVASFTRLDGQNINFGIAANSLKTVLEHSFAAEKKISDCRAKEQPLAVATGEQEYGYLPSQSAFTQLTIPKRTPYTLAPFLNLRYDDQSVEVGLIRSTDKGKVQVMLQRVNTEKELSQSSYYLSPTGTLKFHRDLRGQDVAITFVYCPARVAVWAEKDNEENTRLGEAVGLNLTNAGFQAVNGAEVDAAISQINGQDDPNYDTIAQTLNCAYVIIANYSAGREETAWDKKLGMYLQWQYTVTVNLLLVNMNNGAVIKRGTYTLSEPTGKLTAVDHWQIHLIACCVDHILGETYVQLLTD